MMNFTPPLYQAPFYLRNGHLNTIIGSFINLDGRVLSGVREIVPYSDGNSTSVYIHDQNSEWVVLSFHGLGGNAESDFVNRVIRAGRSYQVTTVAINHRNSGDAHGMSTKPYHSGRGDDIADLVKWARRRFPNKKIMTIGYSMSASMILNLRAGRSGTEQPELAIAINPPVDLRYSSTKLISGFSKIYGQKFTGEMRELIHGLIAKKIVPEKYHIPTQANIWDVDELFTAPMSGFQNALHYYQEASSLPHLEKIKEDTLIIAAEDDPFIKFTEVKKINFNSRVKTHFMSHGGHVGFVSGWKQKWSDLFLKELFQHLKMRH